MVYGHVKYSIKILAVIEPDGNLIPASSRRGPEPRKVVQVMELNFERACWGDFPRISIYAAFRFHLESNIFIKIYQNNDGFRKFFHVTQILFSRTRYKDQLLCYNKFRKCTLFSKIYSILPRTFFKFSIMIPISNLSNVFKM